MSRQPNAITRNFNCPSCDHPCNSRRGLSVHIAKTALCFNVIMAQSKLSSARLTRSTRHRHPPSNTPPPTATGDLPSPDIPHNEIPDHPAEGPPPPARRHPPVTIEDVEDEEPPYAAPKVVIDHYPHAGSTYPGEYLTSWEAKLATDRNANTPPWSPFTSTDDWDVAKWLTTSGVSQSEMNKFLKLMKVRVSELHYWWFLN